MVRSENRFRSVGPRLYPRILSVPPTFNPIQQFQSDGIVPNFAAQSVMQ
jgi:hypothetical protein